MKNLLSIFLILVVSVCHAQKKSTTTITKDSKSKPSSTVIAGPKKIDALINAPASKDLKRKGVNKVKMKHPVGYSKDPRKNVKMKYPVGHSKDSRKNIKVGKPKKSAPSKVIKE